jgi:phage terminase small subunit
MHNELTNSQKVFCQEYIYDWNATRAYKVAYPTIKNDHVAQVAASRLLLNVVISEYITEIQKDLEKLAGISRKMVADEFAKIAFSNTSHLRNTWMELREFEDLTEDQKACIQEIETKTVNIRDNERSTAQSPVYKEVEYVKIKLYDKQKALENLNKMLGYNEPEKKDITVLTAEMPKIEIKR